MISKPIITLVLAAGALAVLLVLRSGADGLGYEKSWPKALKDAREDGKPILLNFGGSW